MASDSTNAVAGVDADDRSPMRVSGAHGSAAHFTSVVLLLAWSFAAAMLLLATPVEQHYYVTEKTLLGVTQYFVLVTAMGVLMFPLLALTPKLKLYAFDERRWMHRVALLAIVVNVVYALTVDRSVRYVVGGVYENLPLFLLKSLANYAFMLLAIRCRASQTTPVSRRADKSDGAMVGLWTVTFLTVIDGLASAATLLCFWACWTRSGQRVPALLLGALAAGLLALGLQAKFPGEQELDAETMMRWSVHRFVINEEQLYTAINDDRFGGVLDQWQIVLDQNRYAIGKIVGGSTAVADFKSFSEYLFYQMYGGRDSGSSPGAFLAAYLLGGLLLGWLILWLAFLPVYLYVVSLRRRFGIGRMACLLFVLKPVHADIPSVLAVVSLPCIFYLATLAIGLGRTK
jgi:hypothetical protein